MAILNADSDGFLTGSASESLDKIAREIEILKAIHQDTSATLEKLSSIAAALTAVPVDVTAPASMVPVVVPITTPAPASPPDSISVPAPVLADTAPGAPSAAPATPAAPAAAQPQAAPETAAPSITVVIPVSVTTQARAPDTKPSTSPRPSVPSAPQPAAMAVHAPVAVPAPKATPNSPPDRERDENGRWRRREAAAPAGAKPAADSPGGDKESRSSHAMEDAADTLKGVASAVGSGAEGIDPTVQAVKEVSGIFSPVVGVMKPLGRVFGIGRRPEQKSQRENVMWYRRIWGAVKGERGGGGGGMGMLMTALLSMLGMLLAPIKALGRLLGMGSLAKLLAGAAGGLGRMLPGRGRGSRTRAGRSAPGGADSAKRRTSAAVGAESATKAKGSGVAGRAAGGEPGGKAKASGATGKPSEGAKGTRGSPRGALGKGLDLGKSVVGKGAGMLGGGLKGLLRKIPVLGALLGGAMVANAVMADDDPNATPDEKASAKADKWGTVGGVAGGVAGAAIGSLLGPLGTIAGGIAGDYVGSLMGEWLSKVDFSVVSKTITDTFTAVASGTLELAKSGFESLKGAWNSMVASGTEMLQGMTDGVKEAFGKAVDSLLNLKDIVSDKIQGAKDYVGEKATGVKDAGQNLLNTVTGGRYTGGSNARKDELIKAMDAGGITDQKSKAMLMANLDHESGGFTKNEENLNYSAKRLQEVFPKYYSTPEAARADANNPEAIANKVYGGRMGNTEAGDGFKYRGRGDIQLTGKKQYEDMGKKLGVDLVNNPDLAKDPKISAQIAVQHWKSSGADRAAMAGDQDRARKLTNGGTNGLEDVKSKYDGYLAQAKAGDLTPTRRADQGTVQAPVGANAAMASTMAAVKGAPTVGVTPITPVGATAARPAMAPGVTPALPGAQTVGVMAPTAAAPAVAAHTIGTTSLQPVSAGVLAAPSYSAPAPDAASVKIAPTPVVEKPLMGPSKPAAAPNVQLSVPLSQNLEDRQIAHVAGGGMGMGSRY